VDFALIYMPNYIAESELNLNQSRTCLDLAKCNHTRTRTKNLPLSKSISESNSHKITIQRRYIWITNNEKDHFCFKKTYYDMELLPPSLNICRL
jgi:hypothetical protein